MLFVRSNIENPTFDSQTKDYLNTPISKFGSTCNVSDKFIDKIAKMGIMNSACEITDIKDLNSSQKGELTFFHSIKYKDFAKLTKASYCLTKENLKSILPSSCKPIISDNVLLHTCLLYTSDAADE